MTATLPVAPGRDHSGVPPFAGAAVGHVPAAVGVSVVAWGAETALDSAAEDVVVDVVVDEVSFSEPHAASIMTTGAAETTRATQDLRVIPRSTRYSRMSDEFLLPRGLPEHGDGNEAIARWSPADQRAEPLSRGVRRAQYLEASVAVDPRRVHGHRVDESVGGQFRARARGDRVRSTRARPYPGHLAGDVLRTVRR